MTLLDDLRRHRLIAIVRGRDSRAAVDTCLTLAEVGVELIEVSLTTERALEVIETAASRLPGNVLLGAGTVINSDDVARVRDAGAGYLVTPALAPSLDRARELDLPALGGALTPSEIVEAQRRGAAAVKIFPASVFGPTYIQAVREPLPHVPLVPVGGAHLNDIARYLESGATAVGVGSPLCGDAPNGGPLRALRKRARLFLDAVQ